MRRAAMAMLLGLAAARPAAAQQNAATQTLLQERRDLAAFLRDAPITPRAAMAHQPVGTGLTLGPKGSDIPVEGLARHEIRRVGRRIMLLGPNGVSEPMKLGGTTILDPLIILLRGTPERPVVTVYGPREAPYHAPSFYPPDPAAEVIVTLEPAKTATPLTLLDSDGVDAAAVEAGWITFPWGDSLRVRRVQTGEDESELELFFRDATNGRTTYPAGRFVTLVGTRDGRWIVDFNRARNPSCAYSTVFPCPAPWPGNTLRRAIAAGERYEAK